MRVVLFCGGQGLRLRDHSESLPKPMVSVGYRPILWHVMRTYAHWGHRDFILALGYRADTIKDYFLGYNEALSNDFVLHRGGRELELVSQDIEDWEIRFADTGLHTNVGQRLLALADHLQDEDMFLANYGDVLTDAPLPSIIEHFRQSGKLAGFVAVRPRPYTFHLVDVTGDHRVSGIQDIGSSDLWINGGYLMFRREFLAEIGPGEDLVPDVFPRLIERGLLAAYRYDGFWAPMDTIRDWQRLGAMADSGNMPWAVWNHTAGPSAAT